jgi:hypothetical protein
MKNLKVFAFFPDEQRAYARNVSIGYTTNSIDVNRLQSPIRYYVQLRWIQKNLSYVNFSLDHPPNRQMTVMPVVDCLGLM